MKSTIIGLMLSFCSVAAVMAQSGRVHGRVTDEVNGQPLPGATVVIQGTYSGTATDLSGEFTLALREGSYTLEISYIGYAMATAEVEVEAGQTVELSIDLGNDISSLSGVTVTGNLMGQMSAINQQRSADNIVTVVSAEQIGRFPDPNAAEALQRVSGVNIQRDQGEGRYVFVRGLGPKYTNVSINGEQIPSPEDDVRFVALDAVPSDQLANMEIYKSLIPELDHDAIGGSVNLVTRKAETDDLAVRATGVLGYNNLMGLPNLQGSLQLGQRFADSKLGVMVNASYYHNELGSDNWERDQDGTVDDESDDEVELRDYELVRTRLGLSTTLDYQFNPNHGLDLRVSYNDFSDREWRRRYIFVGADQEIERTTKDRYETQEIFAINLNGKSTLPFATIDYGFQFSDARQDTPFDVEGTFIGDFSDPGNEFSIDFSDADYPAISNQAAWLDNSFYEFDELTVGNTLTTDQNWTGKVNVGFPYQLGGNRGIFKVGGKVRFKTKDLRITENVYEALEGASIPTLDAFAGGLLDDSFLGSQYTLNSSIDLNSFTNYFNANPQQFELDVEGKRVEEALEAYDATEDVYAAFAQVRQEWGKLTAIGGVRYELTEVRYDVNNVIFNPVGDLEAIEPVSSGTTYDFLMPSLNLTYKLSTYTQLRLGAGTSYARPNFGEIIPGQEFNLEDEEITQGNSELKPTSALNLDLRAEHYFGNVGMLAGGVYYKQLDDFVYTSRREGSYSRSGVTYDGITFFQAQNGFQADILGVELTFQRQLDMLPGALAGLGFYANYTYTAGDATVQSRADGAAENDEETVSLPGQTDHLGNVALFYDWKGFTARVALNYSGAYLDELDENSDLDVYIAERAQLDVTAGYTVNETVRVFAEFLNVTNQPFEAYQGANSERFIQREFYSWWSRFGVALNF